MGETIWIRKNRWWWVACNPNEALGMCDSSSFVRARTRKRLIEKALKRWGPKPFPWEVIELPVQPKLPEVPEVPLEIK